MSFILDPFFYISPLFTFVRFFIHLGALPIAVEGEALRRQLVLATDILQTESRLGGGFTVTFARKICSECQACSSRLRF